MQQENKRVLLGMSGGTDSSVAAIVLQDAGYEVTGVTFRFYEWNDSTEYLEDACNLASRLGMAHIIYDARSVFKERIMDYFTDEYMSGRTPVPCALCNNYLKWPLLAQLADEKGIYYIATGHYARKQLLDGKYYVRNGIDPDKDQSFFLWGLTQNILQRMLLPMGDRLKHQVRSIAAERGFDKLSKKKDSIGVCFCPLDYHSFLRREVDAHFLNPGYFVDEDGKILGRHEGYPFYTIGQRRGLGIHLNRAVFVKNIDPVRNEVVLAPLQSLEKREIYLKDWNIVDEFQLLDHDDIIVKVRYRKQENRCVVHKTVDGYLYVHLYEPLAAIAPGQAAIFYKNGLVFGGGIIV